MPERSNGADSRSVGLCLRGFESSFPHFAPVTQPGLECFPPKEEVASSNLAGSVYGCFCFLFFRTSGAKTVRVTAVSSPGITLIGFDVCVILFEPSLSFTNRS